MTRCPVDTSRRTFLDHSSQHDTVGGQQPQSDDTAFLAVTSTHGLTRLCHVRQGQRDVVATQQFVRRASVSPRNGDGLVGSALGSR